MYILKYETVFFSPVLSGLSFLKGGYILRGLFDVSRHDMILTENGFRRLIRRLFITYTPVYIIIIMVNTTTASVA